MTSSSAPSAGTTATGATYLRAAAATLRERAAAATPGLWQHMCLGSEGCLVLRRYGTIRERGRGRVARFGHKDWQADHADAEYVATMAPPVAEALACWLDAAAQAWDEGMEWPEALAVAGAVNASAPVTPDGSSEEKTDA
jgi:hypothetical protein